MDRTYGHDLEPKRSLSLGKVTAEFTMSLDGLIAGPNDEVDRIFRWYYSGDTEFPVAGGAKVFKL